MKQNEVVEMDRDSVTAVKVSIDTHKKVTQLNKFMRYAQSGNSWGKDQKLLKYNILQVPNTIHYKVLLAMGKRSR